MHGNIIRVKIAKTLLYIIDIIALACFHKQSWIDQYRNIISKMMYSIKMPFNSEAMLLLEKNLTESA